MNRPALSVLVLLAGFTPAPAHSATEITFGITSATAFSLPHYIATEKKFYEAEDLALDTIVAGAAAGVLKQLAAGSLNIAQAATDQSLRAMLHGAPIRIVAGAAANAPFRLIAAKEIKSWGDLKGRTVSVGGLTDVTLYFLRVMARKNGLADADYDLLYGAMLTNPIDFAALEQGFVDLGSVPAYLPNWAQNNILVDTRWAEQNRPAVVAFLRAHVRAIRYLYDPANRDEVIDILARHTRTAPKIAEATYDLYMRQQVIARDGIADDGIKANFDALVAMGEIAEAPPLTGFIDASFLAQASK